jgi:shikimate dehydrogenase
MSVLEATKRIGLLGYPVSHSLSPAMHNAAFAQYGLPYIYSLLPTTPDDFAATIQNCIYEGFAGWNITVPHKERLIPLLHEASDEVRATGACNTVRVEGSKLLGFNTDPTGFMAGLAEAGSIPSGSKVVILGAGGAARAVAWALASARHDVCLLSRKPEQAERVAAALHPVVRSTIIPSTLDCKTLEECLEGASMLVNCTPAGMWPHSEESPLPTGTRIPSTEHLLVYDLVYRPRPTRLLVEAAAAGCRTQDGLAMLVHQGAASFRLWTGREAPVETMRQACIEALAEQKETPLESTKG